jgi:hypothetical protein
MNLDFYPNLSILQHSVIRWAADEFLQYISLYMPDMSKSVCRAKYMY